MKNKICLLTGVKGWSNTGSTVCKNCEWVLNASLLLRCPALGSVVHENWAHFKPLRLHVWKWKHSKSYLLVKEQGLENLSFSVAVDNFASYFMYGMGRCCLPRLGRDHRTNLNLSFVVIFRAKMLLQLDKEIGDKPVPCRYTAVLNGDRNAVYRSF